MHIPQPPRFPPAPVAAFCMLLICLLLTACHIPGTASAHIRSGDEKMKTGDLDGAIAEFDRAVQLEPNSALPYIRRAAAKSQKGDKQDALADAEKAASFPSIQGLTAYAYEESGAIKYDMGDLKGSLADYDKAIALKPDSYTALAGRSQIRLNLRDMDGAIADTTKALELKPDFAPAYVHRAMAKGEKHDRTGAMNDFAVAITLEPNSGSAHHARGVFYYDTAHWKEAVADLQKVPEGGQASYYAHFYLWLARAHLGETDAATKELADYRSAHQSQKEDQWPSKIAGFLIGDVSEDALVTAAENPNKSPNQARHGEACFYAGSKHLLAGDTAKAKDYFTKALATDTPFFYESHSAAAELKRLGDAPSPK